MRGLIAHRLCRTSANILKKKIGKLGKDKDMRDGVRTALVAVLSTRVLISSGRAVRDTRQISICREIYVHARRSEKTCIQQRVRAESTAGG